MTTARDLRVAATAVDTLRRVEHAHARGDQEEVDRLLQGVNPDQLATLALTLWASAQTGDALHLFPPPLTAA